MLKLYYHHTIKKGALQLYNNILLSQFEHIKDKISEFEITYPKTGMQHIYVKLKSGVQYCPVCNSTENTIHGYSTRKILHSYSYNIICYIMFKQTRFKCKMCSKTFYINDPFTSKYKGISTLTVMNILVHLRERNNTFSETGREFNLSPTMVSNIFDDHVKPVRKKLPEILCIDEVYTRTNNKSLYSTVLLDFQTSDVIDVLSSRHKGYLIDYFEHIPIDETDNVKLVVMDMWPPYLEIVYRTMPNAKIAIDPFHVLKNITMLLNRQRLKVAKSFENLADLNFTNDYFYLLRKFGYILQNNYANLTKNNIYIRKYKFNMRKKELLNHLLKADPKLKELYLFKEIMINLYNNNNSKSAPEVLEKIISNSSKSEYSKIRKYSKMLHNWRKEILNAFTEIDGNKYHNGKIERKNLDIKILLLLSNGYKNQKRLRARIMYSINKDTPITL